MMSDVCKHCHNAPCLEACPTGALFRTEFDTVVVQQDICNGCGYCVPACPFGVVELSLRRRQGAQMHALLRPAEGRPRAGLRQGLPDRLDPVRRARRTAGARAARGSRSCTRRASPTPISTARPDAPGATGGLGHLNAFFLLTDAPEIYNLPAAPTRAVEPGQAEPRLWPCRRRRADAGCGPAVPVAPMSYTFSVARAPYGRETKYASADTDPAAIATYYDRPQLKQSQYGCRSPFTYSSRGSLEPRK